MALFEGVRIPIDQAEVLLSAVTGMVHGETRIITDGENVYLMRYDANSTATATVVAHPFVVTPADGSPGRWVEQVPSKITGNIFAEDVEYTLCEAKDSNGDVIAKISVIATDLTDATQDATLCIYTQVAGTLTKALEIGGSGFFLTAALPTSDPTNANQLYANTGVVTVSSGS
jgi:hypothetical protein